MKNFRANSLFLTFISLLLGFSCSKEPAVTTVKGRVVDGETGAPIAGASLVFWLFYGNKGKENVGAQFAKTDGDGYFYMDGEAGGDFYNSIEIYKEQYLRKKNKSIKIIEGTVNDLGTFSLTPKNGYIRLTALNSSDLAKLWLFFEVEPDREGDVGIWSVKKQPISLSKDSSYTEIVPCPGNKQVYIYWGSESNLKLKDAPFKDSVYVAQKDTVPVAINY